MNEFIWICIMLAAVAGYAVAFFVGVHRGKAEEARRWRIDALKVSTTLHSEGDDYWVIHDTPFVIERFIRNQESKRPKIKSNAR